jgi:hypothetical protein
MGAQPSRGTADPGKHDAPAEGRDSQENADIGHVDPVFDDLRRARSPSEAHAPTSIEPDLLSSSAAVVVDDVYAPPRMHWLRSASVQGAKAQTPFTSASLPLKCPVRQLIQGNEAREQESTGVDDTDADVRGPEVKYPSRAQISFTSASLPLKCPVSQLIQRNEAREQESEGVDDTGTFVSEGETADSKRSELLDVAEPGIIAVAEISRLSPAESTGSLPETFANALETAGQTKRVELWLANQMPPSSAHDTGSERSSNADSTTTFSSANTALTMTDDGSERRSRGGCNSAMTIRIQTPAIFKVHKDAARLAEGEHADTASIPHGIQRQSPTVDATGKDVQNGDDTSRVEPDSQDDAPSQDDAFSASSLERYKTATSARACDFGGKTLCDVTRTDRETHRVQDDEGDAGRCSSFQGPAQTRVQCGSCLL